MAEAPKLVLAVALVLSACGTSPPGASPSTITTNVPESTTTTAAVEKGAVFDFGPIAGDWGGMIAPQREGATGRFPVEISLDREARRGSVVGSFRYTDTDDPCRGTLSALRVDGFEYVLFHSPREGDCSLDAWSGQLRLLYNSETDELNYHLALDAAPFAGTLERAGD